MKDRRTILLGLALVLVTVALYWPATRYDFINMDDDQYVSENPHVTNGLSAGGIEWAFTTTYAANWHPLTWISHMLDWSVYGLFAGGHHLTNIVLHAFNTLLLFLLLRRLTGTLWPAAMVAALFGWHPLHVESVAWIAERKDVLSTAFWLLTMLAYARYVELSKVQGPDTEVQGPMSKVQSRSIWYAVALVCFALGLMSKPMLVTLPFALLLLDYWSLKRVGESETPNSLRNNPSSPATLSWSRLIIEKIPFFALSLAACAITVVAQHAGGALKSAGEVPFEMRALNALVACATYVSRTLVPLNLCAYYPLPARLPVLPSIASALALACISYPVFRWRARFPWLIVGWLWFLGTLVPVIGLMQVGKQAMADRYTYVPLIGLFVMLVWSADRWLNGLNAARAWKTGCAALSLVACLALTHVQLGCWQNSITLFERVLSVTRDNGFAELNLAAAYANSGNETEAIAHYRAALRINPDDGRAHYDFGVALASQGKTGEALAEFTEALRLDPDSAAVHNNLGILLASQGKMDPAIGHFREAMRLDPQYPKPYLNYAFVLQKQGQAGAAVTNYTRALELDSGWPEPMIKLAFLYAACPEPQWHRPADAVKLAERANDLTRHEVPTYLSTLARANAANGNFPNAVAAAELALKQAQAHGPPELVEPLGRELEAYRAGQIPPADWRNPPGTAGQH